MKAKSTSSAKTLFTSFDDADCYARKVANFIAAHTAKVALYNTLEQAVGEDIYEVTIKSESHTATIAVNPRAGLIIATELQACVERKITALEQEIREVEQTGKQEAALDASSSKAA